MNGSLPRLSEEAKDCLWFLVAVLAAGVLFILFMCF